MNFYRGITDDLIRMRALFGGNEHASRIDASSVRAQNIAAGIFSIEHISQELCIAAGITLSEKQLWFGLALAATFFMVVVPIFLGLPLLALLGAVPTLVLKLKLENRANTRAQEFEKDYTAFLLGLASSVRTGLDPLQAMGQSAALFDTKSEMGKALLLFRQEVDRGIPEDRAIREFGGDIRHPDISMFRAGFMLSRKEGSSLAECLLRLARVTRQRQSFRRKMKSGVAMQRLSGFGIAGCSLLICSIQALSNPQAFKDALHDPTGVKMISAGVLLICCGTFWMLRMTRTRV